MHDRCSSESYEKLKQSGDLGRSQAMYLSVFMDHRKPMTHLEATEKVYQTFGVFLPPRNGRLTELQSMGFIEKQDVVFCKETQRSVNRWWWTGRKKPLESKKEWRECNHCKGKGGRVEKVYFEGSDTIQRDLFN